MGGYFGGPKRDRHPLLSQGSPAQSLPKPCHLSGFLAELTAPLLSLSLQWGPQLGRGWPHGPRHLLTHPSSQHQVRAPLPGSRGPRRLSKNLPLPFAPGPTPSRAPATRTPSAPAAHCRRLAPVVGPEMAPVLTLTPGQARALGVPTSLPASLEKTQQLPLSLRWGRGVGRLALQAGTEVGGLRVGVLDRLCLFPLTKIQEAPVT